MKRKNLVVLLIVGALFLPNYAFSVAESCRELKQECKAAFRDDGDLSSSERHACKAIFHYCKAGQWYE